MRCEHCKHWRNDDDGEIGECRRYPPTLVTLDDGIDPADEENIMHHSLHPMTTFAHSCGEFST